MRIELNEKTVKNGMILKFKDGGFMTINSVDTRKNSKGNKIGFYWYESNEDGTPAEYSRPEFQHFFMLKDTSAEKIGVIGKNVKIKGLSIYKVGNEIDSKMGHFGNAWKLFSENAPKRLLNKYDRNEDKNFHLENSIMVLKFIETL